MHNPSIPPPAGNGWREFSLRSQAHFDLAQPLDRGHDLRNNTAWLEARLADPATVFVPVWRLDNLVAGDPPRPAQLSARDMADWLPRAESVTLLGVRNDRAYFAVGIPDSAVDQRADTEVGPLADQGRWTHLRAVADALAPDDWH
ncbi:MAG: NUDIX-like domain-containing protein, partial [Candidatus Roseilinea sp.]|uniref:NUDIX-like domain-containing protein n=1 Tax=Candidatus Roseilinea sp. TaxID=2838777 RepID=UPI00404AFE16